MAIGLAGILGYQFPINFNNPYTAISIKEFWQKWQDKQKEVGNWTDTLDWVAEEMLKCDWNYV
jgi:hypothetical protein